MKEPKAPGHPPCSQASATLESSVRAFFEKIGKRWIVRR